MQMELFESVFHAWAYFDLRGVCILEISILAIAVVVLTFFGWVLNLNRILSKFSRAAFALTRTTGDSIVSEAQFRARLKALRTPSFDAGAFPAAVDLGIASGGFVSDRSFVQVLAWEEFPTSDVEFQFRLDETRVRRAAIVERAQRIAATLAALTPADEVATVRRRSRASVPTLPVHLTSRDPPRRVWSARTLNAPLPHSPRYPRYDPIHVSSGLLKPIGPTHETALERKWVAPTTSTFAAVPELLDVIQCEGRFDICCGRRCASGRRGRWRGWKLRRSSCLLVVC